MGVTKKALRKAFLKDPFSAALPTYLSKAKYDEHEPPRVVRAKEIFYDLTKSQRPCVKCINSLACCWVNTTDEVCARCAFHEFSSCDAGPPGPMMEGYRSQSKADSYTALKNRLEAVKNRNNALEYQNKQITLTLDAIMKGGKDGVEGQISTKETTTRKRRWANTNPWSGNSSFLPDETPATPPSKKSALDHFISPLTPTSYSPRAQQEPRALLPALSLSQSEVSVGMVLGSPMSTSSSDISPPPAEYPAQLTTLVENQSVPRLEPASPKAGTNEVAMSTDNDLTMDRIKKLEQGLKLVLDENMDLEKRVKRLEKRI